jgi:hypothetical protein
MCVQFPDALTTDSQGWQRHPAHSGLPAPLIQLIGRDDALAASTELVATYRLVTLMGPGGIGKTQLDHVGRVVVSQTDRSQEKHGITIPAGAESSPGVDFAG